MEKPGRNLERERKGTEARCAKTGRGREDVSILRASSADDGGDRLDGRA
jgi:hypothetical protein